METATEYAEIADTIAVHCKADTVEAKAATCTEDGVKSIHCKNCTATKDSEVIQALDHNLEKIEKEEANLYRGRLRRILELYELPEAFRR